MIKQHSWTRQQYTVVYRLMRRGIECDKTGLTANVSWDILKAADYSYQAHGYWVSGWASELRRKRFYQIVWRILTQRGELPF